MKFLKRFKSLYILPALLLMQLSVMAQSDSSSVDMADTMRANGKIYVVVACLVVIFVGIIIYLISLDRKLLKLEKLQKNK